MRRSLLLPGFALALFLNWMIFPIACSNNNPTSPAPVTVTQPVTLYSTYTHTPTGSATPTLTITLSPTITYSPTSTWSPVTVLITASYTPTFTPTVTFSPTITDTPAPTLTFTVTSTPTNTGTNTLTPVPVVFSCSTPSIVGNTGQGPSGASYAGYMFAEYFWMPDWVVVNAATVYLANASGLCSLAIYGGDAGSGPTTLMGSTQQVPAVNGLNTLGFTSPAPAGPQGFWIAVQVQGGTQVSIDLSPGTTVYSPYLWGGFPSYFPGPGSLVTEKIYVTAYTCPTGWTLTFTPTPTKTNTPTSTFTPTITFTPTHTPNMTPCSTASLFGKSGVGGNATVKTDYIAASRYTLSERGVLSSLSVDLPSNIGGNVRMGIYSSYLGGPQTLIAQTGSQAAVMGWNSAPLTAPVFLPPGDYWLAFQASVAAAAWDSGGANTGLTAAYTYGAFPTSMPGYGPSSVNYSIYGSYCPSP